MRVNRLYVDQPLAPDAIVSLDPDAAHHLARVLRLRAGSALRVFDGRGNEFEATLTQVTRKGAQLRVEQAFENQSESPLQLTLVQGVSRGERMDLVMQKATELGVRHLTPMLTERSVVRLNAERRARRQQHWQRIVINACEQCGRNVLPQVDEVVEFDQWLAATELPPTRLVLQPGAVQHGRDLAPPVDQQALIAIGPEGGFSPRETELLQEQGFIGLSLGPRILRTETAALAALAMLQSHWGDL